MAKGLCVSVMGMFVMACSGCGGGGGGAPAAVAQAAPPAVKAVSIGANGDSLTRGTVQNPDGTYRFTDNTAPANLQKLLQASLGSSVMVANHGVGGATVADVLNGVAGYKMGWKDALPTNAEQIQIAKWAVNDSNPVVNESTTVFENDLIYWIQITQAAGKTVVLEEPNPVCNPAFASLPQYVAVIDKVAAQLALPLIKQYDYILSLPNWQSYLGADCTHPADDRLYQIMAQREHDVVQPIVASLQK